MVMAITYLECVVFRNASLIKLFAVRRADSVTPLCLMIQTV